MCHRQRGSRSLALTGASSATMVGRAMRNCLVWMLLVVGVGLEPPPAPTQLVVLTNDATVSGVVVRVPDGYRITSGRSEQVIAAERVVAVCGTHHEALAVLRQRANLRDADERVRLARWCRQHGLAEATRHELAAALALDPQHRVALGLQRTLQTEGAGNPAPAPASPKLPMGEDIKPRRIPTDLPRLSERQMAEFTRRVQPILRNSCGTGACHGSERDNVSFRIVAPLTTNGFTPAQTQKNLDQVWAVVDRNDWEKSPLLSHALRAHGGSTRPPLHPNSIPFQTLAVWVQSVSGTKPAVAVAAPKSMPSTAAGGATGFAADQAPSPPPMATVSPAPPGDGTKPETPQALDRPGPKPPPASTGDNRSESTALEAWMMETLGRKATAKPPPAPEAPVPAPVRPTPPEKSRGPTTDLPTDASDDPFDVGPFNRRYHPERDGTKPKK